MGEQSPEPASTPTGAVFLSYASQDADAAKRICDALRAAGIEVWFDQSELRGGDAWDRRIREQIHDCRLFIAVVSAQTETRDEGYFRREWRLAVERVGDMAQDKAFVVPVAIDGTSERTARVPDPFKHVQWTRLPGGEASPAFVERIRHLLSPAAATPIRGPAIAKSRPAGITRAPALAAWSQKPWMLVAVAVAVLGVAAYLVIDKPWVARPAVSSQTVAASASSAAFSPPPHSIAVLPFVNMSGDKEQEYFSDGLSEELLNDLSRIHELRVCARTSSFSFKGKDTDIGTIARKLNVGAVLEGSVRRSAHTLRVTAQLIDSVSGYHLWSQTYDRDPGDALKLQTEIAEAVASALKVTLLGDVASRIEVGGTRNPVAYDAYLRAMHDFNEGTDSGVDRAIAGYREALRLDPNFAQAFAALSIPLSNPNLAKLGEAHDTALKAIQLAPDLAEGHLALAIFYDVSFDFMGASKEFERAVVLGPGNVRVLKDYGAFTARMGHPDAGVAAIRAAVALDPTEVWWLGQALRWARRYDESLKAFQAASSLDPGDAGLRIFIMANYYDLGEFQKALSMCEELSKVEEGGTAFYLPMIYHKLGRAADAEASLKRLRVVHGGDVGYELAAIYAQWGNTAKALEWLEKALQDPDREDDLRYLKIDPLLDPIRNEPRFKAVERALKFPD
jgi:TolB-like protein/Flp pilus assembly protein TadD